LSSRRRRKPLRATAFINIPYDQRFERLYLALISGLCGFGLAPSATIQISGSARRLDRILTMIRGSRYSFHDLSRVELDRTPPPTPRLNMAFELGLAVACAGAPRGRHEWFVFEARSHRLGKSLSDLGGTDPYIHDGTPHGLLRALTNALVRRRHQPTVTQLERVYRDVRATASAIKQDLRSKTLYEARAFKDLVAAAIRSAEQEIAVKRG
jgi:hypothetical protein